MKAAVPQMISAGNGRLLIAISSAAGLLASRIHAAFEQGEADGAVRREIWLREVQLGLLGWARSPSTRRAVQST